MSDTTVWDEYARAVEDWAEHAASVLRAMGERIDRARRASR